MQYLTKKQLDEIAKQLATNSKKDSDFAETTEITGDDFVAVVQDGINKKFNVNAFRNALQNGPQGESAYEVAVRHGFPGTEEQWLESLEGQEGPRGQAGPRGFAGLQGIQGPQGPTGLQGSKGDKGDKGDSGVDLGQVVLSTSKAETTTGKALDASVAQYKIGFTDEESEIEEIPSNYYKRTEVDALIDAQRIVREQKELEQDAEIASFEDTINDVVESYKPIVINGNVTNAPDEEDITSKDGLLKFKDRSNLNGMGYCILRRDKSFAEQVTNENTIYEIRYDFDLRESFEGLELISEFDYDGIIYYSNEGPISIKVNQAIWVPDDCVVLNEDRDTLLSVNSSYMPTTDENVYIACTESKTIEYMLNGSVTMPANCVLKFNGGSISGAYILTGDDTKIESEPVQIFGTDITIAGTWGVDCAYPEWFGANGDGLTDDSDAMVKVVDSFNTIKLTKTYACSADINIKKDHTTIFGKGKVLFDVSHVICAYNCDNIVYRDFSVETIAGYSGVGVRVGNSLAWIAINPNTKINYSNILFDHISVDNYSHGYHAMIFGNHGIFVKTEAGASIKDITIQNCTSRGSGCSPDALSDLNGCDNIYVSSYDTQTAPMKNVKILNNTCEYAGRQNISVAGDDDTVVGVVIKGNYLKDSTMAGIDLETANDVTISDNVFVNSGKCTLYYDPAESIYPNGFSLQSAICISAHSNTTVANNIMRNCKNSLGGSALMVNCELYDTPSLQLTRASYLVSAIGCSFYFSANFTGKSIDFYNNDGGSASFDGCYFEIDGGDGIYLKGNSNVRFTDCRFKSSLANESLLNIALNGALVFRGCKVNSPNNALVEQSSGSATEIAILSSIVNSKRIQLSGRAKKYRIQDSIIDTKVFGGTYTNTTNCCVYVKNSEIHTTCAIIFAAYEKVCMKDNIFVFSNYDNTPISGITDFNDAYLMYTAGGLENGKISIVDNRFNGVPDVINTILKERNKSSTKALVYDIYANMFFGNAVEERTFTVKSGKTASATGLIERNSFNGTDI